jgi:uncharacterized protein YbjQ (UPF0145 family)
MLKTTTDTLPQPFTPVGLVSAEIGSGMLSTERNAHKWLGEAEDQLEAQTQELGGDAIIAIRVSALVGTLMVIGTAVKLG